MITKDEMLPLLLEACPSFIPTWQEMESERGQDEHLVYSELGSFAHHLIQLQVAGQTTEFAKVFDVIERFHTDGDGYVQEAATIGLLEGVQNHAGHSNINEELFLPHLKLLSKAWWHALNRFWSGESPLVTLPDKRAT